MSHESPRPLSPDEERSLRESIRGLAEVSPDPTFRADLRRRFVEGEIGPRATSRTRSAPTPRWRSWRAWTGAVVAAACLVIVVRAATTRTPWTLREDPGTGSIIVDGNQVALADARALSAALAGGGTVHVPEDSRLALALGKTVVLELTGGLDAVLPPGPRRWWGRLAPIEVLAGELRAMTGPALGTSGLRVDTRDGHVEVTGTIFSVVCDDGGTCVCVLEGTIRVGAGPDDMDEVPAGMRKVMFRDGRPSQISESAPPHRAGLEEFRARLGTYRDEG